MCSSKNLEKKKNLVMQILRFSFCYLLLADVYGQIKIWKNVFVTSRIILIKTAAERYSFTGFKTEIVTWKIIYIFFSDSITTSLSILLSSILELLWSALPKSNLKFASATGLLFIITVPWTKINLEKPYFNGEILVMTIIIFYFLKVLCWPSWPHFYDISVI